MHLPALLIVIAAPGDYMVNESLAFTSSNTTHNQCVRVQVFEDRAVENIELFRLVLTATSPGITVGPPATVIIHDGDSSKFCRTTYIHTYTYTYILLYLCIILHGWIKEAVMCMEQCSNSPKLYKAGC